MSELEKLKLECGVTLELKPVKQTIALEFISKLGGLDALMQGDASSLATGASPETLIGFIRLLNYFAGWGVANQVPSDARDELSMLGSGERMIRSLWVRDIMTTEEVSQLFAQVMALTFQQNGQPSESPEVLRARIAELEAKATDG